jgi:hypothetical protein
MESNSSLLDFERIQLLSGVRDSKVNQSAVVKRNATLIEKKGTRELSKNVKLRYPTSKEGAKLAEENKQAKLKQR